MKTRRVYLSLFVLLLCPQLLFSQTGPWAKYDQELKDGALYREASQGNLEEVKSIVAGGGNIHFADKQTKNTILMAAAGSGKIEVVRYLLDKGVSPDPKDWWGYTALDKARFVGAKDIVASLQGVMEGKKVLVTDTVKNVTDKPVDKAPAPAPVPPPNHAPASPSKWAPFGSYSAGDSVLYWTPVGWRRGVIKEVGVQQTIGRISVDYSHRKYYIDPDAYALSNEWQEWSSVTKLSRQPFWTQWFLGEWQIGEVQAHHNEIKAGKETDRYYYMDATEKLQVFANNTYRWQLMDGKVKTGKWSAVPNEPGIILHKAYRDFDWTLRNATTVDDWKIRKLDLVNLKPSAQVMSINGKRKTTE